MKSIGKVLLPIAIVVGLYALFIFDPSVAANDGRVVNLQKLSFQQNLVIASGVMAVVGAILLATGGSASTDQSAGASVAPFAGVDDRNLESDEVFAKAIRDSDVASMRRLLVSRTVSAHGRNRNGRGWLQFATAARALEPCRVLVEHGAMPSDKDDLGVASLTIATTDGNQELVALFSSPTPKTFGQ